jgi:hypothetical protein
MRNFVSPLFFSLVAATAQALDLNDLGQPTGRTPYDQYFGSVMRLMASSSGQASLAEVQKLNRQGRSFRYSFTTPYIPQAPDVTEATRTGDCKAKSLWMADRLRDGRLRFVVGKLREGAKQSHAWLMWNENGNWWVIDPTVQSAPKPAAKIGQRDWVPLYSYTRTGTLKHNATARYAINWDCPDPIGVAETPRPTPWWLRPLGHEVVSSFGARR